MLREIYMKIRENIPLAPLTTFKIGGPARFFVIATHSDDLKAAFNWAKEKNIPILILGGGSNLLVPDEGWQGLAIRLAIGGWNFNQLPKYLILNTKYSIQVGAGVYMIPLAIEATRRGLTGLEWAGGLPGTLGGAIRGNAGSFRFEIGQSVKSVEIMRQNQIIKLDPKECGFGYRTSLFKKEYKNDIILSAELELAASDPALCQKQLKDFLAHRHKSQPPWPSAGCVFKNFCFANEHELNKGLHELLPSEFIKYKKIPAGWLVEQVEMKGARVGGAQVSPRHANFIVNVGRATALDILTLIGQIKEKVYNKFQIELEEETQIIQNNQIYE